MMKGFIRLNLTNGCEISLAVKHIVGVCSGVDFREIKMTYHSQEYCHQAVESFDDIMRRIAEAQKEGEE